MSVTRSPLVIDYDVAIKEWRRLLREEPERLRMTIDPSGYDTMKPKHHVPGLCDRCSSPIGRPGFLGGRWPLDHPYIKVVIRCPLCNNGKGGT